MKIIQYMQEGGVTPAPQVQEATTAQEGGQDPLMQLVDIFSQGLQTGNCEILAQGAQLFLQLIQQSMNQGAPQGPVDQVPQGQPIFKRGGKLIKRKTCKK